MQVNDHLDVPTDLFLMPNGRKGKWTPGPVRMESGDDTNHRIFGESNIEQNRIQLEAKQCICTATACGACRACNCCNSTQLYAENTRLLFHRIIAPASSSVCNATTLYFR
jgi:hypothetical protein